MDTDHFGYALREARLKAGRSLEDISRKTKIPTPQLEKLERGDAAELPADVFVIGFLRSYAREIGLGHEGGEEAVSRFRRVSKSPESIYAAYALTGPQGPDEGDADGAVEQGTEPLSLAPKGPPVGVNGLVDAVMNQLTARVPALEGALGRGPAFALVLLLVVLVATLTLSILLGGDPRPGRGLS